VASSAFTPGRWRHLGQSSTPEGHFVVLALDHRGNLRGSLDNAAGRALTDAEFAAFKSEVIAALLPEASAVLTDPEYGLPGFLAAPRSARAGLLMPLEVTDYSLHPSRRTTTLIEGWGVERIKRAGGSGVKLLLYYHPGAGNAANQRLFAAQVLEQCHISDIPFFLEPIAYSLDPDKPLPADELRQVVIDSARTFSEMGVDVLKLEFPCDATQDQAVWHDALHEMSAVCTVPWTLLSAGVSFDIFVKQVQAACEAGASGVIAGRAVWSEAVALQGDARSHFLATTARERMRTLAKICANSAARWQDHAGPSPALVPGWFHAY